MKSSNARIQPVEPFEVYLETARRIEASIAASTAVEAEYYWLVSKWARVATGRWARSDDAGSREAALRCVAAALMYFYGPWREVLETEKGLKGHEAWLKRCLWFEKVQCSLTYATALSDWDAVRRIAAYPPEDGQLPQAAKARGETAWGWALVCFLRNGSRGKVEAFLEKAVGDKAKRPKLLAPVLRALLDEDASSFSEALLTYLAYYRKSEFKSELDRAIALDGTTLYHLGRKAGMAVELPEKLANHVIRFS